MKRLEPTGQFKRDLRRVHKRGYKSEKLETILTLLRRSELLPPSCRPHPLKGRWSGYLECHIAPDWLLIYRTSDTAVTLVRTGTHSDLFDE